MPISSSAVSGEKRRAFHIQQKERMVNDYTKNQTKDKDLLTIGPALPLKTNRHVLKRSYTTVSAGAKKSEVLPVLALQPCQYGMQLLCTHKERENNTDYLNLDRRGLTSFPVVEGTSKLRLLSLQHNLLNSFENLKEQQFPNLVFLDVYDNQLDRINFLDNLMNIRVLMMGKNRIRKIEGLHNLTKMEVLDLHGNEIQEVNGLSKLTVLRVLNLAGNKLIAIGPQDLHGLITLQELNLKRNKIKKLMGFGETPNLEKLFLSNNDIRSIDDMSSVVKSSKIRELSIDNNPIFLEGDCTSFVISYLPFLSNLNSMQITEQVRKTAMAWRRNKETNHPKYMDLGNVVSMNDRREEIISNARINWELIRSQTKCLTSIASSSCVPKMSKFEPDIDFTLTPLMKRELKDKDLNSAVKIPALSQNIGKRTTSQETDNSQNASSSSSGGDFFRLPPILVPIINKIDSKEEVSLTKVNKKVAGSITSIGPNVDSSISSLTSSNQTDDSEISSTDDESDDNSVLKENELDIERNIVEETFDEFYMQEKLEEIKNEITLNNASAHLSTCEVSSNLSVSTSVSNTSSNASSNDRSRNTLRRLRSVKSAAHSRTVQAKVNSRAVTAKPKCQVSSSISVANKEREQGGDYLIEICGRFLNIYGHGSLRFIDKNWNRTKANDVTTINFNYASFNAITGVLGKIKQRFSNAENFVFKETNMQYLGQLNALSEVQGMSSLHVHEEGNPIILKKNWKSFAIYRLSHWGLKYLNGNEITEQDISNANDEFQSLSDLVLWSLPDSLLRPLLGRLHIDVHQSDIEQSAKKWLYMADPALRKVVSKEALQWKKSDESVLHRKARNYYNTLIDNTSNAVHKLRQLEEKWPSVLQEIVQEALLDYSNLDMYMKEKMQELL